MHGSINSLISRLYLSQALKLLAETMDSIPLIFLVTDGTVENEREICQKIKDVPSKDKSFCPRISTFGIGKGFFQSAMIPELIVPLWLGLHYLVLLKFQY